ncbi:hypothetical protein LA080_008990 [Diaporthe eres]|nr:hypothetical protein LA080_008990 [Diaporthe eres]
MPSSSHHKKSKGSTVHSSSGPKYSHKSGFQDLYKRLNKNSKEASADELWAYILRRYFGNDDRSGDDYSIAVQQRVSDQSDRAADLIIKTIRNNAFKKIIFIEDKRTKYETHRSVAVHPLLSSRAGDHGKMRQG